MNPAYLRRSSWLVLLGMAAAFAPALGQAPDRSGSHGPIPPSQEGVTANPAQLQQLAERFRDAAQREWLQNLLETAKSKRQDLQRTFEDPEEKKSLENLAESIRQGRYKLSPDEARRLYDILKDLDPKALQLDADPKLENQWRDLMEKVDARRKEAPSSQAPSGPDSAWPREGNDAAKSEPVPEAPKPGDPLPSRVMPPRAPMQAPPEPSIQAQPWFAKVKDWVGNNRALQDSPSLHQALKDLANTPFRANLGMPGGGELPFGGQTPQWISDRLPSGRFWTDSVMPRLRDVPLPSLPNVDLPNVHFSTPSLPSLDLPSVSAPAPSSSRGETIILSLFTVAVVALILWRLYGERWRRKGRTQGPDWVQGDAGSLWPPSLDLSSLRSREDLIRAFEQLSLVKLGSAARSWNHLHLAASLGGKMHEHRRLADHLAFLYEQARYAPADSPLSPDALRLAHRELATLAGAAHA